MKKEKKVLIVDDDANVIKMLSFSLEQEGYEVSSACSGEEAIQKVARENPNLILLDIKLPGMNGYEVCHQLKKNPSTAMIPIIILSIVSDVDKNQEIKAEGYVMKPFSMDTLVNEIKNLFTDNVH